MTRGTTPELRLSPNQIGELVAPARLEIYESIQAAGPGSIADLARRLGRAADSLYYHVRKLVEIGVIEQVDDEFSGAGRRGRNGAVYGAVARTVTMTLDAESKASRDAWTKGAAAVLRLAERNVRTAVESGTARTEGAERDLLVRRTKLRLTREQLREFNGHLDGMRELMLRHAENEHGQRFAVNVVMTSLDHGGEEPSSTNQEKGNQSCG